MTGFLDTIMAEVKARLFTMIFEDTVITTNQIRDLVNSEKAALKLLAGLDKCIQTKMNVRMIRNIWKLLTPIVQNFQETFTMVEILCSGLEDTDSSPPDPDLQMLAALGLFQDKEPTGLNMILESIKEDMAEEYEFFWSINPKNDQEKGGKAVTKEASEELKDK